MSINISRLFLPKFKTHHFFISFKNLLSIDFALILKSLIHKRYISPIFVIVMTTIPKNPNIKWKLGNRLLFIRSHRIIHPLKHIRMKTKDSIFSMPIILKSMDCESPPSFINRRICKKMLLNSMSSAQTANPV